MSDIETLEREDENIDVTCEPGVIAERYQKGEMVTRENLTAFIAHCLGRGKGKTEGLVEVLNKFLEEGVVSLKTIQDIGEGKIKPEQEELDLIHGLFKKVLSHSSFNFTDKKFIWNEAVIQFKIPIKQLNS